MDTNKFSSSGNDSAIDELEIDLESQSFKNENLSINSRNLSANVQSPIFDLIDNGDHNSTADPADLNYGYILPNENLTNLDDDTLTSIARSAFADMLHDQERNYLYKKAIKKVLGDLLETKQYDKINSLDIGAGTGLLSMFMHRTIDEFAQVHPNLCLKDKRIIALEQFFYSYLSAKEIIALNKMDDRISLTYKNSMIERLEKEGKPSFTSKWPAFR